jgi:hypothetical protein
MMKVGDRVRVVVEVDYLDIEGEEGVIVGKDDAYDWWVRLDVSDNDLALNENELEVIEDA